MIWKKTDPGFPPVFFYFSIMQTTENPEPEILNLVEDPVNVYQFDGRNPILEAQLEQYPFVHQTRESEDLEDVMNVLSTVNVGVIRSNTEAKPIEKEMEDKLQLTPKSLRKTELIYLIRAGVGMDNLDAKALAEQGILITNTPEATSEAVAEHSEALIQSLFKKIGLSQINTVNRKFEKLKTEELFGKKVLIIAAGRIGASLGAKLHTKGMKVEFFDPFQPNDAFIPNGPKGIHGTFKPKSEHRDAISILHEKEELQKALAEADVVSIHADVKHIIGPNELQLMADGNNPYIINTARGHSLDLEGALPLLKKGKLRGLGLDVFPTEKAAFFTSKEGEQIVDMLGTHNLAITHHAAGNSVEGQEAVGLETAQYIAELQAGMITAVGAKIEKALLPGKIRLTMINRNEPGAIARVTDMLAEAGLNIDAVPVKKHQIFGNGAKVDLNSFDIVGEGTVLTMSQKVASLLRETEDSPIVKALIAGTG